MTVCVLPDLTWLPLLGVGRKSWYIIIITIVAGNLQEVEKESYEVGIIMMLEVNFAKNIGKFWEEY